MHSVGAEAAEEGSGYRAGRTHDYHRKHQSQGQQDVQLTQAAHPDIESGHHRRQRDERDHRDDEGAGEVGGGDSEQVFQAGGDLPGAEPEGRGQSENGGEDRQEVDDVPGEAPHPVSQQRVERGTERQGEASVVGEEREGDRRDPVARPAV